MRSRLGQFAKTFPGQKVGDVTNTQVETWLRGLKVAPLTRNNFRRVLLTSFNLALERGYCLENPAAKAAKAKQVETPVGILSVDETTRLLRAAPSDMVAILAIGAFAGLRRAELERLDWSDINLSGGFIEIKAAKAKSARRRIIKIQPNPKAWLTPCIHESGPVTQGIFQPRLVSVRSAAGLKQWPHNALRHGFASYHLARFNNAAKLALEMGHTNANLIFSAHRQIVQPAEAARYWKIQPAQHLSKEQ